MSTSLRRGFTALLYRDLLLAFRRRAELLNPLLFFVLVITLFPLGIGARPDILLTIAPGIIWVSALLAALLSLDQIFRSDFEDGSLEQFLFSAQPVAILVLAKICAHWLVTGLPLILVSPLLAVFLGLSFEATGIMMLTLLLGTPVLSFIGAIAVALTVGLRKGGMLLSLLVLPLYVPVLIFAAGAVDAAASGLPVTAHLALLGALLALSVALAPFATAAALRISLS